MATIALYAGKINRMPGLIRNVKTSVTDYKTELSALRTKLLTVDSSLCSVEDVVSSIQSATQTQKRKISSLSELGQSSEAFAADTAAIDSKAAELVRQRKEDFYQQYAYLRPEREQRLWDKVKESLQTAGQWCREHWKLVVTAVIAVVAVVVLCILFPAVIPFVVSIAEGALKGALIGGLMGGGMNALLGESFWEGFKTGALWGAVFGGIGGAGKAFAGCCQLINYLGGVRKVFPVIAKIAKISGTLSAAMCGFDLLAFGARLFNPSSPLAAFNQKLHSNGLYNAFQFTVNAVAAFSTAAYLRMRQGPPVCFGAGTLILTASGLTAIENIKAGDRVLSTNPETFETEEKTVLETYVRKVRQLVHLTVKGELITTTMNHPFWVKGKGFVEAGELKAGDELVSAGPVDKGAADRVPVNGVPADGAGEVCIIEKIRMEIVERPEKVYNFQVEDFHTYHVGSIGVLVHNAECGEGGSTAPEGDVGTEGGRDVNPQSPMFGEDWHRYFNETYGQENVMWGSASIQDIIDMPSKITDFSPEQIANLAQANGWSVGSLGRGSLAGVPYEQGGGFSIHAPNGGSEYIQYHPGGGHHGELPYFKISSGPNGIVRYFIGGNGK